MFKMKKWTQYTLQGLPARLKEDTTHVLMCNMDVFISCAAYSTWCCSRTETWILYLLHLLIRIMAG